MAGMEDLGTEVGQLRQDIASIKGDLGALMTALKDLGAEQGQAMYGRVREAGDVVRERAREAGEVVRGQAVQAQEQVGQYIENRPLTSVMIAFGTGFALGTLVGNRALH
jgi:ElaB/YqjD/DUF883 family membrane-anchored ribosome-binding protein